MRPKALSSTRSSRWQAGGKLVLPEIFQVTYSKVVFQGNFTNHYLRAKPCSFVLPMDQIAAVYCIVPSQASTQNQAFCVHEADACTEFQLLNGCGTSNAWRAKVQSHL